METVITISGADKAGSLAGLTFASLVMGIVASGLGLYVVGRGEGSIAKLLMSGVVTGLGVALMHYTLGQSVFIVSAVVLVLLLAFSAWKSQRSVMADL